MLRQDDIPFVQNCDWVYSRGSPQVANPCPGVSKVLLTFLVRGSLRETRTQSPRRPCPACLQPPPCPWVPPSPSDLLLRSSQRPYRGATSESLTQEVLYSFPPKAALKFDYNYIRGQIYSLVWGRRQSLLEKWRHKELQAVLQLSVPPVIISKTLKKPTL